MFFAVYIRPFRRAGIVAKTLDPTAVFFAVQVSIDGVNFNGLGAAATGQQKGDGEGDDDGLGFHVDFPNGGLAGGEV